MSAATSSITAWTCCRRRTPLGRRDGPVGRSGQGGGRLSGSFSATPRRQKTALCFAALRRHAAGDTERRPRYARREFLAVKFGWGPFGRGTVAGRYRSLRRPGRAWAGRHAAWSMPVRSGARTSSGGSSVAIIPGGRGDLARGAFSRERARGLREFGEFRAQGWLPAARALITSRWRGN